MTEQAIIQQVLNGNTSSFEQLVFLYEKQLMRFLKIRCHCPSDAEDIFQETFLNAHLYLHSYNNRFAFSTWLFNISLNIIKKQMKAKKELSNHELEELAHDSLINKQDNIWYSAKQHLTSEQFCLLWFTYAEEYTGSQVATVLERSLPWVKINLIRVKKILREKLSQQDYSFSDLARG